MYTTITAAGDIDATLVAAARPDEANEHQYNASPDRYVCLSRG